MTDLLDNMKARWQQAEHVSEDNSLTGDLIKQAISEDSTGITGRMMKVLTATLLILALDMVCLFVNAVFYRTTPVYFPLLIVILILCSILSVWMIFQRKKLENIERRQTSLLQLLQDKISFFRNSFTRIIHLYAFAVMLIPFNVNLYQERAAGGFKGMKLMYLMGFYLFAYLFSHALINMTHSVCLIQLKSALSHLKENTGYNTDLAMKQNRRRNRIIMIVLLMIVISGVIVLIRTASGK